MRERKPAHNSTFAIGGVSCSADTFVQSGSSVLRVNISAKKPAHRKYAKRYTPSMRLQIAIVLFSLASCRNKHNTEHVEFNRIIPDTSKTWAGRITQQAFNQTRIFVRTLNLEQLINGTPQEQIRVWYLSGSYDPQVVFILKADSVNKWSLRTISFYRTKSDSIYADYSRVIRQSSIDSLNLNKYWHLTSQSDLSKGDTYGCMDGEDVFIEMSNRIKYKFTWYRCPEINKNKDISFHLAAALVNRLDALAVEH